MDYESECCDQESLDILLARAVWEENPGAVKFLLKQGANPLVWPEEEPVGATSGIATVNLAVIKGNEEVVKILLNTGEVNVNGRYGDIERRSTLLVFAAQYSSLAMVDLLLDYGHFWIRCMRSILCWTVMENIRHR